MNISCEIIRDLLPLYYDGVCSNESKALVEEHLSCCENCREEYDTIDKTLVISNKENNLSDAEAVKNLSRSWKKGMIKSLLEGVLFTLITVFVFACILYLFAGIRIG